MKTVSLLLASWILLLSIQIFIPQVSMTIFQADRCHASCSVSMTKCTHCPRQSSNSNSSNPFAAGMCNPFQTCAYCFGMTIESSDFQFAAKPDSKQLNYSSAEIILSNYSSSCWHPPKII